MNVGIKMERKFEIKQPIKDVTRKTINNLYNRWKEKPKEKWANNQIMAKD